MLAFERLRGSLRVVAVAACAVLALSACAEAVPTPETHGIERCFDGPLPSNTPSVPPGKPPKLSLQSNDGFVRGDPTPTPSVQSKLEEANVTISDGKTKGSGFLTQAPDGSQVVITAGHVIASNKLREFKATNNQGQEATVSQGCYVLESDGVFGDLFGKSKELQKTDFAILRLFTPLGGTALHLADNRPQRGDWVTFVNSKGKYTAENPARYNGIVAEAVPTDTVDWQVLTGVQPWRKSTTGEQSYLTDAGASGSMVANPKNADVFGISTHGGIGYLDAEQTEGLLNITFDIPVGEATGLLPLTADIVGAEVISYTLANSNRY